MKFSTVLAVMFAAGCGAKPEEPGVVWLMPVELAAKRRAPLESTGDQVRAKLAAAQGLKTRTTFDADARGIRFVSYDCVLNGASGIEYLDASALKPELARITESTARELRAMAPIFARGRPIALPFEPPTGGWMARAWTYHGRDYLILANRTRDRQWKVPEAALERTWRPLFETRREPRELLKKYQDAYYLKPYQVLVLESRLRPKRLLGL